MSDALHDFFEGLIRDQTEHKIRLVTGERDSVVFKDQFLLRKQLTLKYFSRSKGDLRESVSEDFVSIDGIPPSEWVRETPEIRPPSTPPVLERFIFTVAVLTRRIKEILTSGDFANIWIKGELSNVSYSASGHVYFNIKDEEAILACALFKARAAKVRFRLENGLKVEALGSISVYEKTGRYQLIVEKLSPEGQGELQLAFEQLKKKLSAEGLFDPSRKRPIPRYPSAIGIVTSPTGAALRDIIRTTEIHFPKVRLLIYPAQVQGDGSALQIAAAIRLANRHGLAEVLIVGRGGGSQEDLWAFNEESVARAIFESRIPIVSAVGHEVDYSIADFVADHRSATPTAAAELVSVPKKNLVENLRQLDRRVNGITQGKIRELRVFLEAHERSRMIRSLEQNFRLKAQYSDDLLKQIQLLTHHRHRDSVQHFLRVAGKLDALSPFKVLGRGYSIVMKEKKIITQGAELSSGDQVEIRFHRDSRRAVIE